MSKSREDFLIWQYRGKPKARQTVGLLLSETSRVFDSVMQLSTLLDVNTATGYALDLTGRHTGIGRVMKAFVPKDYFGWAETDATQGFNTGTFYRYGDSLSASLVLSDEDYRFFIKARIYKNYQSPDIKNITFSVRSLLGADSLVVDNCDMSMNIIIRSSALTQFRLHAILNLDILVRPVGVKYRYLVITDARPFGWLNDADSFGFNDGKFTRLINVGNKQAGL